MGLGRTARYYKYGSTVKGKSDPKSASRARKKKSETDKELNKKTKDKRAELGRERYKRKKRGENLKGKDVSHTKGGFILKDSPKNRGSKVDMPGDRRSRGGGKRKKK